jgi:hypothetical protein
MHPKLLFVLLFSLIAICFIGEKMKPAQPPKKPAPRSALSITHLSRVQSSQGLRAHSHVK